MSQLRYEELHPEFGASVRGVDLGKPLTPELVQEINAAIVEITECLQATDGRIAYVYVRPFRPQG